MRLNRQERLRQADLHNRLSVWGLPFYLMFGLTGAFFGLVGLLAAGGAWLWYDNDRDALIGAIYGEDPIISAAPGRIDYAAAFSTLRDTAPHATPIYLILHQPGRDGQFLEIAATLPGRLIYSEIYRFASDGRWIDHQGLSDGPAGRQVAYSVYRLHFGHFGGLWSKLLYGALGMALTIVCATGTSVWLTRRKQRSHLNLLWPAFVWGTPLALALAALATLIGGPPMPIFLTTLALTCILACLGREPGRVNRLIQITLIITLVSIPGVHVAQFSEAATASAALHINGSMVRLGGVLLGIYRLGGGNFGPRSLRPLPSRSPS